jgi:type IV secretory pathway TrbD component
MTDMAGQIFSLGFQDEECMAVLIFCIDLWVRARFGLALPANACM